jgi:8-oxo-dGTP pyrophosphatase MutT (NUDIX family)
VSEPRGDPPPFAPFDLAKSERVYDSYWCALRRDYVKLADGRLQEYHVFEIHDAVAVVPVLPDGSIVMLWQYRHPLRTTHWEVPAGRVDEGESAARAAERELLEETGYRPRRLVELGAFHPTNGISPHHARLFAALGCELVATPAPGPCEKFSVHAMSEAEVRRRLGRGHFKDGFTALALFYYFASREGRPTPAAGGPDGSGFG